MLLELNAIKIPFIMAVSTPNPLKINNRKERIMLGEKLHVTVDVENELTDGYTAYLAYKELGYKMCPVVLNTSKIIKPKEKETTIKELYRAAKGKCYICGRKCLDVKNRDMTKNLCATIDHVVPLSKNGENRLSNMKLACNMCNRLKGNFTYSKELAYVIRQELREMGLLGYDKN